MALPLARGLRVLSSVAVIWHAGAVVRSQDLAPTETAVKAVFLYNFSKYVSWPVAETATEGDAGEEFRICVIADPAFTEEVRQTIDGESVNGRMLTTAEPRTAQAARQCRMLFVGDRQMNRAAPILRSLQGSPVLTVGESPEFLDQGGVIAFVRLGNNVRFDINRGMAQKHGLTISSQLLRLAHTVRDQ